MKKNHVKLAKTVIDLEIQALSKIKNSLGKSFNDAIELISKNQSKVILCGVGKSGIIASKISATLSSVGTPSYTISASDSSHGDLGSISKKDILILISYSGNTQELKKIANQQDIECYIASDIKSAIKKFSSKKEKVITCFGSLYLVGKILSLN